ncbi:3-isopropylmalate dehydratase, large subunit [Desulfacinum hydrothermale DSM 13146]|uniref:3-isopropylmalate dehydratase large subunit n=1 Tax=Desulfacinum hydrothermale DSM 13146 TaxID=1121390 RepID=A0A1W1XJB7_9BACT|nr:3-isopropylmalate dehydratase large subunit [Desulfacinum hydrothermale]SMC24080.1 3-isopropylmalate dehydratase, large subunit [Desulfacinum hydrothermale DSM 13146]
MSMTLAEKILAAHAGRERVEPGQLLEVSVDFCLGNDITAPIAIQAFREAGVDKVFDPERIALIPDHFVPNKDIASAMQVKMLRDFAREQGIPHYYEVGRMGIEHALLPEQGLVLPGDVVIGADSHTCTYGALGAFATGVGSTDLAAAMVLGTTWFKVPASIKFVYHGRRKPWVGGKDLILHTIGQIGVDGARYMAMEFTGPVVQDLPMSHRMTMSNMAIEAGAKVGLIEPDQITRDYVDGRAQRSYVFHQSDPDARYEAVYDWDVSSLDPMVALPHLPENVKPVTELPEISIDQVVIGSCTNGRLDDLREAAAVLKGHKVSDHVRCIIIPATQRIYRQAMQEGLLEIFLEANAAVSTPTCGPCLGGHMGILAQGERAVATTNRNFVGRMGHPESEVYLSSPAVAAASAVLGRIAHPEEVH